jgi:hypothetical protein
MLYMATIQVETPNGVVYFQPNDEDHDIALRQFDNFLHEIFTVGVSRGKNMVVENCGAVAVVESEDKELFTSDKLEVGFRVNSGFNREELLTILGMYK